MPRSAALSPDRSSRRWRRGSEGPGRRRALAPRRNSFLGHPRHLLPPPPPRPEEALLASAHPGPPQKPVPAPPGLAHLPLRGAPPSLHWLFRPVCLSVQMGGGSPGPATTCCWGIRGVIAWCRELSCPDLESAQGLLASSRAGDSYFRAASPT